MRMDGVGDIGGLGVPADHELTLRDHLRDVRAALHELADRFWVRCAMEPLIDGRPFLEGVCEAVGFVSRTAVWTEHAPTAGIRPPGVRRTAACPAALSPERPHADCGAPPAVVR